MAGPWQPVPSVRPCPRGWQAPAPGPALSTAGVAVIDRRKKQPAISNIFPHCGRPEGPCRSSTPTQRSMDPSPPAELRSVLSTSRAHLRLTDLRVTGPPHRPPPHGAASQTHLTVPPHRSPPHGPTRNHPSVSYEVAGP